METGYDKDNENPDGFQREIKIKGQRLEEMKSFNYLGSAEEIRCVFDDI